MTSETSARARAFVAEKTPEARGLGLALAELIDDPDAFADVLREGFGRLADPAYAAAQATVAPGSGTVIGVRWPLVQAVARQLRQPLAQSSSASALWLAERLAGADEHEVHLFSHVPLRRALEDDPERAWQLMRRLARAASDWVAVDSLAHLYAQGVLAERFRWAELEQLVYSQQRWERRLVGATLATIPFRLPHHSRPALRETPGLTLIKSLIGDAEPDVQKSLSWALRSWYGVDPAGAAQLLRDEAQLASADQDGHRAWVLRDALTLPDMDRRLVLEIRSALSGVRRRPGVPSTSNAARAAAAFSAFDELSEQAVAAQGERQRKTATRNGRAAAERGRSTGARVAAPKATAEAGK